GRQVLRVGGLEIFGHGRQGRVLFVGMRLGRPENQRQAKAPLTEGPGLVGDDDINVRERHCHHSPHNSISWAISPPMPVMSTRSIVGTVTWRMSTTRKRTSKPCLRSICASSTVSRSVIG